MNKNGINPIDEYGPNERARRFAESNSCVIFLDIDNWLEQIGSGTLIYLNEKYFVCTAAHVIYQCNRNQLQIGSVLLNHQFFDIVNMSFLGGRDEDKEDLAWIEVKLPNGFTLSNQIEEANLFLGSYQPEDAFLVSGFPNELVIKVRKSEINSTNLTHFGYITGPVAESEWEAEYDRNYHILLEYQKEMYTSPLEITQAPTAWGLSGGGIWYNDKSKRNLRLAGIQTGWDGPNEKIFGIKIDKWLEFLRGTANLDHGKI